MQPTLDILFTNTCLCGVSGCLDREVSEKVAGTISVVNLLQGLLV